MHLLSAVDSRQQIRAWQVSGPVVDRGDSYGETARRPRLTEVAEGVLSLHLSAKDYGDVTVSPRGQFSTGATALIMRLTNRPHYVAKKRLTRQAWPY